MIPGVTASETFVAPLVGGAATNSVHFFGSIQSEGPTYISIASVACTDNSKYSISAWVRGLNVDDNEGCTWLVHDPVSSYETFFTIPTGTGLGLGLNPTVFDFNHHTLPNLWRDGFPESLLPAAAWNHLLYSVDLTGASGARKGALYINKVYQPYTLDESGLFNLSDTGSSSVAMSLNGKPFFFGDDSFGFGPSCDFSDVWIAPGVSLITGTGATSIASGTLDLFIDGLGKPTDITGLPTSAILFSGDAANFATNRGTGGAATLVGSLVNATADP